ncbi:hypothetical protein ACIF80_33310 [Streptomyces sp. NPDC085927]
MRTAQDRAVGLRGGGTARNGFDTLIPDTPFPAELHTALSRAGTDVITA